MFFALGMYWRLVNLLDVELSEDLSRD